MKIGIFSPYLETLTGGEKYMFTAASCLSKEHEVVIFWDDATILGKASEKFNIDLSKVEVSDNIFSDSTNLFKRFFKTLKYDRIFFLSDGSIPIVGSSKLLIHFQFPVEWVNTNSYVFLFKKSRISKIVCNSYFTKSYIDKKFSTNSEILYPPIQIHGKSNQVKENLILTVGRFSMMKNGHDFKKIDVMVKTFKKFKKRRLKGWKMGIVTSVRPDQEEEFKKFEERIKSRYITVYKNVSYQQIEELYDKAKIYWHAAGFSENLNAHPERAEHFGMSTVEAMTYGAVPIVINAGGQSEIVKDNDNGFLWSTEEELIDKTHNVATNKKLFDEISQRAIESSQRYSVDRFCDELNHIIW